MEKEGQVTAASTDHRGRRYVYAILQTAGRDQTVATPLAFIELMDGDRVAADIINQILFYRDLFQTDWVYITDARWKAEAGITHYQLTRAFAGDKRSKRRRFARTLAEVGVRREKRWLAGSNTWHYTIDVTALEMAIAAFYGFQVPAALPDQPAADAEVQDVEGEHVELQHVKPAHSQNGVQAPVSPELQHVEVEHAELGNVELQHVELEQCSTSNFNNVQVGTSTMSKLATSDRLLDTESLQETLDQTLLGEGDARKRARDAAPTTPDIHPIVQAFVDATPEDRRGEDLVPLMRGANDAALELAALGLTPAHARELVRAKWLDPKRSEYRFDWFFKDMMARAEQNGSGPAPAAAFDDGAAAETLAAKLIDFDAVFGDAETARLWEGAYDQIAHELRGDAGAARAWRTARPIRFVSDVIHLAVGSEGEARQLMRLGGLLHGRLQTWFGRQVGLRFDVRPASSHSLKEALQREASL